MKNKTILIFTLAATLFLLTLFFFSFFKKETLPPIRVGVVLPLSGDFSSYGTLGTQGIQMAAEEINSSGGILGRRLELVIENNESDPNLSVRLMRKLIQEDDVIAVIGPVSSTARNAMTEVAKQFKTPLLYGIDYEGGSFDRYLFCYSPTPDHVISPLVPHLVEHYGSKFYIFGYDYVWPHEMAKAIASEVEKAGGEIAGTEFTPFGVVDFSPALNRIKNSGANVLMLVMCGDDGHRFTKQFSQAGMKEQIQMVAIASEETWEQALTVEELEGIITNGHFFSCLDRPETRSFVERQKKMFGNDTVVTYSTESHYGLVMLLQKAIEKAGTADNREKIIDAMENLQITVGNRTVTLRDDHHMDLNMVIATFRNGKVTVEKDIGLVNPEDQRVSR